MPSDFVYDNLPSVPTKTDAHPPVLASQEIDAADVNQLATQDVSLRSAITAGQWHGLANNTSPPLSNSGAVNFAAKGNQLNISTNQQPYAVLNTTELGSQNPGAASALASNTLTPDFSKGQVFFTLLDHALTAVANPSNSAAAPAQGSIVKFRFQQNGTGYFTIGSWGTNYKGAGNFVPRQGPNQSSEVWFMAVGDGTYQLYRLDGIDTTKPLDVRDYGAKGDGTTDDWTACQAAIDAAQALQQTVPGINRYTSVLFSEGVFAISKPLLLAKSSGVQISGESRLTSFIKSLGFWFGPLIAVTSNQIYTDMPLPLSASHLTGLGNAMTFDDGTVVPANANAYNILTDLYNIQGALSGASAFCAEASFTPTAFNVGATYSYIVSSQGRKFLETLDNAFVLQIINATKNVRATLNVNGTIYSLNSASNSLSVGVWAHAAVTYDGTTIRLFLNGTMVDSHAVSGTVTQQYWEDINIGAPCNEYPCALDWSAGNQACCKKDFVRVSNAARYTSGFTAPTAKPAPDNNAVFQTNFETVTLGTYDTGCVMKHYMAKPGFYGSSPCYSLARQSGLLAGIGDINISKLSLYSPGAGIELQCVTNSEFAELEFSCGAVSIYALNNCFTNNFRDLTFAQGQIGVVNANACGVNKYTNLNYTGSGIPIAGDAYYLKHAYFQSVLPCIISYNGNSDGLDAIWDFVLIADEGHTTMQEIVILRGAKFAAYNCTFEKAFATDPGAPIVLSGSNCLASFERCTLNVGSGQNAVFTAKVAQANPVYLGAHQRWAFGAPDPTRPLTDTPSYVRIQDNAKMIGMVAPSGTTTACSNLGGHVTYTSTGGGAAFTFNLPNAEADASFDIVFTPKSSTGTPAAGSTRILSYAIAAGPPTAITVTLEADPGNGNAVTFSYMILRA